MKRGGDGDGEFEKMGIVLAMSMVIEDFTYVDQHLQRTMRLDDFLL